MNDPTRLAAVDLGSNSFRLEIAEIAAKAVLDEARICSGQTSSLRVWGSTLAARDPGHLSLGTVAN